MKTRKACAFWADMGLGKTVTTLTAIADLIEAGKTQRVLVIAPLRVAEGVWDDEIEAWAHLRHLKVSKILGDEPSRIAAMRTRADVYTINRENVKWLVAEHFNKVEVPVPESFRGRTKYEMGRKQIRPWIWDTVVIDESTSFKNQEAKRYKALRRVRKLFKRCIQLTGTPAPNSLMDLWAQLYLLDHGKRLGSTITAFRNRWFEPPGYQQYNWTLKSMLTETGEKVEWARDQIYKAVSDICFALKEEDYLDLPPVLYRSQKAYLSKEEMDLYRELERRCVLELGDEVVTAINAGALATKLLQIANGAIYTQHPKWQALHDRKLDVLEEMLDVSTGPAIVVYSFTSDLERIQQRLTRMKKKWRLLKNKKDEDAWNAGKLDVLVLHPASAGHGLNLQHAGSELLIWYGLTFNLEHYQQANARLTGGHRRKGKSVVIQHIVAEGTRDKRVMSVLTEKDATQMDLVNSVRQVITDVRAS